MEVVTIRKAEPDDYDEIARVWMDSWVTVGIERTSEKLLADLRSRIDKEIADGWSLYVADDAAGSPRCLRFACIKAASTSFSSIPLITAAVLARCCCSLRVRTCLTKSGCAAPSSTKKPGVGTSAKVSCSRKKSRIPGAE
jgi:hypothetical protein